MRTVADFLAKKSGWGLALGLIFLLGLYLCRPFPGPVWQHVDERAFILHPLGFWSGDFNPHFFNYPTLHFYLASALYYIYYLLVSSEPLSSFIAYRYFVDGGDLIDLVRGFNSVLSALTGVVCALIGRRLYGLWGGLWAGVLFAVLPLAVRFAHLANVDVPQVFWSSLALYFAVRLVDTGRLSDVLWAGACTGLAMATKYPGALSFVPVGLACGLRFGWLRGPMWWSGLLGLGVFAVCSPYVFLDWSSAWESISAMGSEHVLDEAHGSKGSALWHHLRYNLRYGVGLLGLLGLLGGLVGRVRSYRDAEWIILGGLLSWLLLLGVSSSVFMRYALPLGPLVVLFWVRGLWLLGGRWGWYWLLGLALAAEPLYGSYQTRSLLAGEDTRVLAQRWIEENAPPGTYLIQPNNAAGRLRAINPGGIYIRQNYYLQYFNGSDLVGSYTHLAGRAGLPPLYITLNPQAGVDVAAEGFAGAPSHGLLVDYRHPLIQSAASAEGKALAGLVQWTVEFDPGPTQEAVFDAVDWYFLPIGAFAAVERTGPNIRLGVVPLKLGKRQIPMGDFFALLRDILRAKEALDEGDEDGAFKLYEAVWSVPFSLDDTLSPEFMYDVLANMGLAYVHRDDLERAIQFWRAAINLKSDHADVHHNLGAIYARLGRNEEAFATWERALALDPHRAGTHFNMGNVFYAKREYDQAIAAWQRAVDLDPDYQKVYYNIGNAHFLLKRLAPALNAYQQALALDPENSNIHFNIAQIYIEQGNRQAAIPYLKQAIERNPRDPEAYYQLGGLYYQEGQQRQARLSFERLLQLDPGHTRATQVRQMLRQMGTP